MPEAPARAQKATLTRRAMLIGAPVLALGGIGGAVALFGTHGDAPVQLGFTGPFRDVFVTYRDDQSTVDMILCYPYGERHNPYDEGLAHYLEHLAWQNLQGDETDGGRHSNALTSPQATAYWLARPPDQMQATIARLAATAAPLTVSEAFAQQERKIVRREFDLRRLGDPMDAVWVEMSKSLFGGGPYGRFNLGSKDSIAQFTLAAARRLKDQTHQLSSATLLVRGLVEPRDVARAIRAVPNWPSPRSAPLPEALPLWPQAPLDHAQRHVLGLARGQVIQEKTFTPPEGFSWAEIDAASTILTSVALSTKAGGLAGPLRFDAFVAASFQIRLSPLGTAGLSFWIRAEPDDGVSLTDLNTALDDNVTRMLDAPDKTTFEAIRDRESTSIKAILDPSKANHTRLLHAQTAGEAFVPLSDLHRATTSMSFARFRAFTRHLLSPRSAATRLITTG